MPRGLVALTFVCALLLMSAGCGRGSGSRATGKVLLNGQPLADAEVLFEMKSKEGAAKYVARSDAEGKFAVVPPGGKAIIPGTYRVAITKWVDKKGKVTDPAEIDQLRAAGMAKNVVPDQYSDFATTPLTAQLQDGKTELPPFDIKAKGK